jgi:hypothetical protein
LNSLTSIFQCGENLTRSEKIKQTQPVRAREITKKFSEEAAAANAGV